MARTSFAAAVRLKEVRKRLIYRKALNGMNQELDPYFGLKLQPSA